MPSIRQIKTTGRYQVTFESARAGVRRTRRSFGTKKEAREYLAAIRDDANHLVLGHGPKRLFCHAMERYLAEDSHDKRSHADDLSNARALSWPAWDASAGTWRLLWQTPLNPAQGQLSVPAVLELWVRDQQQVLRRSRVRGGHYQQRQGCSGQPAWFHQPPGPLPRRPVADTALISQLNANSTEGPVSGSTLRTRQSLVARVLKLAWQVWDWCREDQSGRIIYRRAAPARTQVVTQDQLLALLIQADPPFADLILGAAWSGLRRANLLGLTWDRVTLTKRDPFGKIIRRGSLWVSADDAKNKEPLWQPMSERLEQLLIARLASRSGVFVFHQGDGSPWADFRKRWATAKRAAGVPEDLRWHDLRATWATGYAAHLTTAQLQALGGWKDASSAERYIRLQHQHLLSIVENHE